MAEFSPTLREAIRLARAAGLTESADRLEERAFAVAYTTSSELLLEAGEAILQFRAREGRRIPPAVDERLDQCLREIGRVWPPYSYRGRVVPLLGSFLFFWIAPATIGGWIPWLITRGRMQPPLLGIHAGRWLGWALMVGGAVVVLECFARFAWVGRGTPAPIAPPKQLVVSGLYRYVRNPMYVGILAAIVGQALLFGSPDLLLYAALVWAVFFAWVVLYEEPTLRRQFGVAYHDYRAHVRRWWPRRRPWPNPR